MKIKKIVVVVFLCLFNYNYSYSIEPEIFVQSTVNRASKILSENISKEKKMDELKLIAKETVDIRGIGFYTLGSVRKPLNDDQKKKYAILFEEYFLKSFSSRLAEYTNPENPLIRDLIIEGLSLARTQKEEFSSILNSNENDINALFKTLEEFSKN